MPMSNPILNEREFELVNIVGAQLDANQRDISRHMNLSLGMTNMLLKRLVTKGYIRIKQLNQRKVQYLLTPKGLSEKMQKSIRYTVKTINSISLIKARLQEIIQALRQEGHHDFWVIATPDFQLLIEMIIRDVHTNDIHVHFIEQWNNQATTGVVLICKEDAPVAAIEGIKIIDVVFELSKDEVFIKHSGERL